MTSGRCEREGEFAMSVDHGRGGQRAFLLQLQVELVGPQGLHASGGERAPDQGPVSVDEAEHATDRYVSVEQSAHYLDLLEHPVDEPGAVARPDEQTLDARPKEAAFDLEARPAAIFLGIDDIHAAGAHGEVVDVRPGVGDPPVVQQPNGVGEAVKALTQPFFAGCAKRPGCG